MNREALLPN